MFLTDSKAYILNRGLEAYEHKSKFNILILNAFFRGEYDY